MKSLPIALLPLFAFPALAQDCNLNGVDDSIDIVTGTSFDCNHNDIPDECEPCSLATDVIDFEGLAEGTVVDTQYAAAGLTFSDGGGTASLPLIITEGSPVGGFGTFTSGDDAPLLGSGALSDGFGGGSALSPTPILMDFDPPVQTVSMILLDVDNAETFTLEAFDGAATVDVLVVQSGDPGTGDGIGTLISVSDANITSLLVTGTDPTGIVGFGIDNLTLIRDGANPCPRSVLVYQESAPGAGDFDANFLGKITPFSLGASPSTVYSYDFPFVDSYNGNQVTAVSDRSHLFLVDDGSGNGPSLFVFHDKPQDGDGGSAQVEVVTSGTLTAPAILLQDDPQPAFTDEYTEDPVLGVYTGNWTWDTCCTDGLVVGALDGPWSAEVSFTPTPGSAAAAVIDGIFEWVAYSDDGTEIVLALEEGRRVRLEAETATCLPPVSVDVVEISDAVGGTVNFSLQPGAEFASDFYFLGGSLSGTRPGFPVGGETIPLNFDAYTMLTLVKANQPPFTTNFGTLDPVLGEGTAALTLPPGVFTALIGLTAHHAYAVLDLSLGLGVSFVSNAAPLTFLP